MKKRAKISIDTKSLGIRIYINDLLHLYIKDSNDLVSFQSWIQAENHYCIEYYLKDKSIITAYNDIYKWKTILNLLNKNI